MLNILAAPHLGGKGSWRSLDAEDIGVRRSRRAWSSLLWIIPLGGIRLRLDQSDRVRVDDVLRPVLPVGVASLPAPHQHLPDAVAQKKYRRLRGFKRFQAWWTELLDRAPGLFKHWAWAGAF